MVKLQINIDEKWPVFTLDRPKTEDSPFTVEMSEEEYREYLWIMYKYHQWQIKMQGLYEFNQHRLGEESCGRCFQEGSEPSREYKTIRIESSEEQLPTVLSESHA